MNFILPEGIQMFMDGNGLSSALRTIYESIKLNGTEYFALPNLYADFLHKAAVVLENPAFKSMTDRYLQLANHWSNKVENALPSNIPEFDQVKSLINKKYQAYIQCDKKIYKKSEECFNLCRKK